jgi:hypothetical protein
MRAIQLGQGMGKIAAWTLLLLGAAALVSLAPQAAGASPVFQGQITVTGTPEGPMILVPDQVNVRTGPGVEYDQIGVMISGQRAPVVGRSPGGNWLQIRYPGVPGNLAWVFTSLVRLEPPGATLPIVEPPPTPTPPVTATIDPTLAAQFIELAQPTRMPTFTPAEPPARPTFAPQSENGSAVFPPILAILGLLVIGLFGMLVSFLRGA